MPGQSDFTTPVGTDRGSEYVGLAVDDAVTVFVTVTVAAAEFGPSSAAGTAPVGHALLCGPV